MKYSLLAVYINLRSYSTRNSKPLHSLLLSMPKETPHVPQLKNQRQMKKVQQIKYPPASVSLQVLGSGANGAPRSLYVFTDQSRYLFNCGEGSQRLAHEHKMKLAKLEHIFITANSWLNVGGLPGVSLTIQDVGVPKINIRGPPCLSGMFEAARKFMILRDLEVSYVDATNEETTYEDAVMKVDYVAIHPELTNDNEQAEETKNQWELDTTDYYGKKEKHSNPSYLNISPTQIQLGRTAVSYVCRLQPKQGTLLLEKCLEYGVPPGPLLGQLKNGEDITLPSGKIVKSSDVRSPDDPGPVFLVVECPTQAYLNNFTSNQRLNYREKSETESPVVIAHFTPGEILQHPKYQEWMNSFSPGVTHLLLGTCGKGLGSEAVHRIQYKLNLVHPEIFPLLPEGRSESADATDNLKSSLAVSGETLLSYHLRPLKKLDETAMKKLSPSTYLAEAFAVTGFKEELEELKTVNRETKNEANFPKFTFLGTGSCIPNKTRNTSAILVELRPNEFLLMDCGEGTFGQIVRFFGEEKTNEILKNLLGIYISHLHADHHIGLIGLLLARQKAIGQSPTSRLFLLAPHQIMSWLSWYDRVFENISQSFELASSVSLLDGEVNKVSSYLKLKKIQTTFVRHCPNAFGLAITMDEGFKFTYSGDTMPCDGLVRIGHKSNLLIHEATMEDGLEEEAKIKTHSTTSQAIQTGRAMEAEFTLLTHFSQRYAKVPIFNSSFDRNVGIAFDNMTVSPKHFDVLPKLFPALKSLFVEDYEEMEQKSAKRLKRLEVLNVAS